ncbi:pseudouridine synthase [Stakelama tenebrarum]|uniref:pseudouridine synthase n=1 Tax=Stakelama tenebrarum TaxID=2711215 RepID=UPI001D19297A|nr:pseudouridine synthase [Sphingosinithalassobacter tenebrarum]
MSLSKSREPQRIAKLLARAGIASRREIERMIAEGRIAIDGVPLDTPATLITSLRGVTVDGKPVKAPDPARLFRFHKPAGVLTAASDPKGRATIYDRLPKGLPRLMPVGRLDLNTEGLLLMTTDGGLKRQLELPASGVERSYRARAYGDVTQAQLEELIEGVEIDGVRYGQIDANLERRTGANVWIELTLTEGKNREVRRVLEYLGLQVSRLIRTRYGPFHLADLPTGAVDEIRQHDLVLFRKTLEGSGGGKAASNLQLAHKPYAPPVPEAAEPTKPSRTDTDPRRKTRSGAATKAKPKARPERKPRPEFAEDRPQGKLGPRPSRKPEGRDEAGRGDRGRKPTDRKTSERPGKASAPDGGRRRPSAAGNRPPRSRGPKR